MTVRAFAISGKTLRQREAETAALLERAADPKDPYNGYHGDDTSRAAKRAARTPRHKAVDTA